MYEPWVLNFPTKDHWRSVSKLSAVEEGLQHLLGHYEAWEITSLAVPPLGCGNGQLDWRVVGPTMYRYLEQLDIPVELYAPFDTPEDELEPSFLKEREVPAEDMQHLASADRIEPGWFALVALLAKVKSETYHHPIGRTIFQKMAYFATEVGVPTGLQFQKASYGPYTPELKKIVARLENNGLIREEHQGRMIRVQVGLSFGDALKVFRDDLEGWADQLSRLSDLFLRIDTRQAEVAAAVHFAAHHLLEGQASEQDVLQTVMNWKMRRRPPLDDKEVASTIRHLNILGWINAAFSEELTSDELLEIA